MRALLRHIRWFGFIVACVVCSCGEAISQSRNAGIVEGRVILKSVCSRTDSSTVIGLALPAPDTVMMSAPNVSKRPRPSPRIESRWKSADSVRFPDVVKTVSKQVDSTFLKQAAKTAAALPPAAYDTTSMSFKDADIRDIFRALGLEHGLNIFVDNSVNKRVTISLTRVPLHEAIKFLCEQNGLNLAVEGGIYRINPIPVPPVVRELPRPPDVAYEHERISLNVTGLDIALVVGAIQEKTRKNILIMSGTTGSVSGRLIDADFDVGFIQLMNNNGFAVQKKNDIYVVTQMNTYIGTQGANSVAQRNGPYWVSVKDSVVTVDVTNAPLGRVISDALRQMNADIVFYGSVSGTVTARATNISINRMLDIVLRNTNYAYKEDSGVYFIGEKTNKSLLASRLFRLRYLRADKLNELLPKSVLEQATVKVIKEQNGLVVVAPNDVENQVEEFIRQVDKPVAQVLIEAIVVDYDLSRQRDFGVKAGLKAPSDTTVQGSETILPGINLFMGAAAANKGLNIIGKEIGVANLGRLPDNFYMNLQAMEQKGLANVRSRPLLATLNGTPASLSIGTTQYFILKTTVPYVNQLQTLFQESDQFHTIQADTKLDIVPYVGSDGLITVDLKPDFKTPVGQLSPEVPPTINQRSMSSTVIMREGETIVLGGLIQETEKEDRTQVPILGDIPLIGNLFSSTSKTKHKSELIIYVTPHISYGEAFQDMDLPNPGVNE